MYCFKQFRYVCALTACTEIMSNSIDNIFTSHDLFSSICGGEKKDYTPKKQCRKKYLHANILFSR